MKKIIFCAALFVFGCAASSFAQPRMVEKKTVKADPAVYANASFRAQYEGGMFGFTKKEEGFLKFDDANFRMVFFDKNNKERFGIPYSQIILLYPNRTSSQSTTGKVVGATPLPGAGIAGMLMKEKKKFMVVSFDDPDLNAKGTINFKLENEERVAAAIEVLGTKAEMQSRGDSYYRPRSSKNAPTENP